MRHLKNQRTSSAVLPSPIAPEQRGSVGLQRDATEAPAGNPQPFSERVAFGKTLFSLQSWHQACPHLPDPFPRCPHFLLPLEPAERGCELHVTARWHVPSQMGLLPGEYLRQDVRTRFSGPTYEALLDFPAATTVLTAALGTPFRIPTT